MAKFKDLTGEELGTIVDWYDRGLYSQRELAEIFNVSRATIRRAVKETRPVAEEISPEVGHLEEVGQPSDEVVGHSENTYAALAVAALIAGALWVAGIIYFAVY